MHYDHLNHLIKNQTIVPTWAKQIMSEVGKDIGLIWSYLPNGKIETGCYSPLDHAVVVCAKPGVDYSVELKFILLHELAHAKTPGREIVRGRMSSHHSRFWKVAIELYKRYDMMEYASKREYMTGRKLILAEMQRTLKK